MPDSVSPTQQLMDKYLVQLPVETIKGLLGFGPTDESDIGKPIGQRSVGTNANLLMQTIAAGLPLLKAGSFLSGIKKVTNPVEASSLDQGIPFHEDYIKGILRDAGLGNPGLSEQDIPHIITGQPQSNYKFLAYRDPSGNPVAAARIIKDADGNWMVEDLANDKSKGLLSGRAMGTLGKELINRGITSSSGTVSPEVLNIMKRIGLVK